MSYDPEGAVAAGLAAGIVMSLILWAVLAFLPLVKIDFFHFFGTFFRLEIRWLIYLVGGLSFLAVSVTLGLVHAAFYELLGLETGIFAWGLIFGLIQWGVVGFSLGLAPSVHSAVREGRAENFGIFVLNDRALAAMAFLGLNILYGMFVGSFYASLS